MLLGFDEKAYDAARSQNATRAIYFGRPAAFDLLQHGVKALAPGSKVSRRLICECKARCLIGRNIPLLTPGRKGSGADPDSGHSQSYPLQLLLNLVCALKPRVVGRRQLVGIAEQSQEGCVVTPTIPRQRNDG